MMIKVFFSGEPEMVREFKGTVAPTVGDYVLLANHGSLKVVKREFVTIGELLTLICLEVENPYEREVVT